MKLVFHSSAITVMHSLLIYYL